MNLYQIDTVFSSYVMEILWKLSFSVLKSLKTNSSLKAQKSAKMKKKRNAFLIIFLEWVFKQSTRISTCIASHWHSFTARRACECCTFKFSGILAGISMPDWIANESFEEMSSLVEGTEKITKAIKNWVAFAFFPILFSFLNFISTNLSAN